jgi:hypothetical protein
MFQICFMGIMKSLLFMLSVVVLSACTSGGGSYQNPQAPPSATKTAFSHYIIVGDSLMDLSSGGELTTTGSLILLEENKSVTNISLAGQTMAGFYGVGGAEKDGVSGAINFLTVPPENQWYHPPGTAVIIELAHNDWFAATPADEFFDSYVRFLEAIDAEKLVSIFCVVPIAAKWDYDGRQNANGMTYEAFRDVVRKVAGTGLCNLVETSGWFTKEEVYDPLIMPDGVHLAAGGHRRYKDRLIQELSKY